FSEAGSRGMARQPRRPLRIDPRLEVSAAKTRLRTIQKERMGEKERPRLVIPGLHGRTVGLARRLRPFPSAQGKTGVALLARVAGPFPGSPARSDRKLQVDGRGAAPLHQVPPVGALGAVEKSPGARPR